MFDNVNDARELITQAVGAGSACWVGGTGSAEFDTTQAIAVADAAFQRLQAILAGLLAPTESVDEHWTDEPRTETQWGVNCGDPAECCDPWFITDDEATAHENAQVIRDPHILWRTATTTYSAWRPIEDISDEVPF